MKGLDLARRYFSDIIYPAFALEFGEDLESMAFGLVGPGSECRGFDDDISHDHDWGPRVCIWISEELFIRKGSVFQNLYESVAVPFMGYPQPQKLNPEFPGDGVLSTSRFYRGLLGTDEVPSGLRDWLLLKEESLADSTNGEVFLDVPGEFSRMRKALAEYFPRDLWLKKIGFRCKSAGRHGQYDLARAFMREDNTTAQYHKVQFAYNLAALAHLSQRRYRPYGKWIFRSLEEFGTFGTELYAGLQKLWDSDKSSALKAVLEHCTDLVLGDLERCGFPVWSGLPLYDAGIAVETEIKDSVLRKGLSLTD